jgi:hypothetical protein
MNDKRFGERGDQHAKQHLITLTPGKEFRICHGCRGTGSGASILDGLSWRLRSAIQEAIHILGFNLSQNLSSPARKVVVGEFDVQGVIHNWNSEDNIGRRRV